VPGERKARYTVRVAQSDNYGRASCLASDLRDQNSALRESDDSLVGEDSREILKNKRFSNDIDRTALIDLVIGQVSAPQNDQVILDQTPQDKYALKSRLFADEAEIVLRRKGANAIRGSKPHVLVIGAMGGTISELLARGFEVTATDMDPAVLGRNLGGVSVCAATENDRLIKKADLTIITGMAFSNRTLPVLMEAARVNNTSTMMWAITGKNLGHYYVEQGVDCVISDPSPFLYLPGPATIGICRRAI
jgi:hypothetical protein